MKSPIEASLLAQYPMLMMDESGNMAPVESLQKFMNVEMSGNTNAATGGAGNNSDMITPHSIRGVLRNPGNVTLGLLGAGFLLSILTAGK